MLRHPWLTHRVGGSAGRVGCVTWQAGAGATMVEGTGWACCPSCALVREGAHRQSGMQWGCKPRGACWHGHSRGDWVDALSLLHPWLAHKEGGGREVLSILPRLVHRGRGCGNREGIHDERRQPKGGGHISGAACTKWGKVSVGVAIEMVAREPLCTP